MTIDTPDEAAVVGTAEEGSAAGDVDIDCLGCNLPAALFRRLGCAGGGMRPTAMVMVVSATATSEEVELRKVVSSDGRMDDDGMGWDG